MSRRIDCCTILFADIAGSTQIYEMLGDRRAQRMVTACLSQLSKVIHHHRGEVIKTIGDEVMCTFAEVDDAIQAAGAMNQDVDQLPDVDGCDLISPNICIGIHSGPVIRKDKDVFGDAVNLAARVVKLAKPRQVLLTEQAAGSLSPLYLYSVRYMATETIKGKRGEFKIYEYLWSLKDATVQLKNASVPQIADACLELTWGDNRMKVDHLQPAVSLGRQGHNELVLNYERVSRSHARIEYRRGKFHLIDHSSNGTYIHRDGENMVYVKRDEAQLSGTGVISLGRMATPGSPGAIHFEVKG